jgi:hypothetical protein
MIIPLKQAESLEIEFIGGINYLSYNTEEKAKQDDEIFTGSPFLSGRLRLKDSLTDKLGYNFTFERDNIFQNTLSGILYTSLDSFNVEFGVFIGICNNFEFPLDFGIRGGLEYFIPGILTLSIKGLSTIAYQYESFDKSYREAIEVNLGFWTPNIIFTLSVGIKNFTRQINDSLELQDDQRRILFSADVYAKNVPYTLRLDLGLETLTRVYIGKNSSEADMFNALFAGLEFNWQYSKPFRFIAGFELPVYLWADELMLSPAFGDFIYKAHAGFVWKSF